jgi:folate-binding protein YgfZ
MTSSTETATTTLAAADPTLGLFVDAERETLRARGSDAVAWLNGLVSSDLRGVARGTGAYGLLLTKTGKIRTDIDVLSGEGELLLGVASGVGAAVQQVLDAHLVMEDVELTSDTELVWLRLLGPGAHELAASLAPEPVAAGAIDWLGTGGAAVVVRREAIDRTLRALLDRAPAGAKLLDRSGWELLRLRHGFPTFGKDYGSDDNPHEAALDRRGVSWDKGCYLGQEVVCMQDMRGRVKRRLAVLRIQSSELPPSEAPVLAGDSAKPVGSLRSAALGEDGSVLAFARLEAPYFEAPGRELSVSGRRAEIVALRAP